MLLSLTLTLSLLPPTSASAATTASMEKQISSLINKERVKHGCKPLKERATLKRAARKHSQLMGKKNTLSHQLRGEKSLGKRITAAGYKNWRLVGENIAYGFTTPKSVVKAWLASPGHRKNILNCKYRDSGIGVVKARGRYWYTQDFGRR